jgi:hypothetical protein
MNSLLYNEYTTACNWQTDINEHLPLLHKLANEVKHVTEFGVRNGQSTRAFLAADCILRSYDLYIDQTVKKLFDVADASMLDKKYEVGNSLEIVIEPTNLLFIDTDHNYNQLKKELYLHNSYVSKYIVMHDTTTYGGPSQGDPIGLLAAVMEFLADYRDWRVKYHSHYNNGLTVLERV